MHHKGRNKHHFEYWTDINPATRQYEPVEMPRKYLAEMVMDRIAACKTYQGAAYTDASPLAYLDRARESSCVNPATFRQLHFLLTMLAEKGEDETFRFIREVVLTGKRICVNITTYRRSSLAVFVQNHEIFPFFFRKNCR